MGDRKYTDTGYRGEDPRHGFGDDMGTRVGRPDGAHEAPRDASSPPVPGQPSTNDGAVADGIEGSIVEGEGQRDVQNASRRAANPDVNPDREPGSEREIYDL